MLLQICSHSKDTSQKWVKIPHMRFLSDKIQKGFLTIFVLHINKNSSKICPYVDEKFAIDFRDVPGLLRISNSSRKMQIL